MSSPKPRRQRDPEFQRLIKLCSKDSYYGELRPNDAIGYCAAGILPFTLGRKKFLFAREKRGGLALLNFIGGKREFGLGETPIITALREWHEETGQIVSPLVFPEAMWRGESKYVLFEGLLDEASIVESSIVTPEGESIELEWLSYGQINLAIKCGLLGSIFHDFIVPVIETIFSA